MGASGRMDAEMGSVGGQSTEMGVRGGGRHRPLPCALPPAEPPGTHCASPPPSPRWPRAPRARSPPTTAQLHRPRWPEGWGDGVQPSWAAPSPGGHSPQPSTMWHCAALRAPTLWPPNPHPMAPNATAPQPPPHGPQPHSPPTPTPRPPTPHLCFGRPRTAEDAVVAPGVGQSHVGQSGRGQQQRRQRPLRVRVAQRRVDPLHRQQPCGDGRLWGSAPRGRVPHGARRAAGLPAPSRGDLAWHNSRSVSSCTEALVAFTLSWMSVQLRNSAPSFLSCSFSCSKASKYLQKGGRGGMWGRAEGLGDLRGLSNLTEPRRGHRWTDGWAAVGWGWGGLDLEGSSKLSDAAGEWAQSGRGLTAGRGGGPLQPEQLHEGVGDLRGLISLNGHERAELD